MGRGGSPPKKLAAEADEGREAGAPPSRISAAKHEALNDDQNSGSDRNLGDQDLATRGQVNDVKPVQAEHSARPLKLVPAEHSVKKPQRRQTKAQPVEKKHNVVPLSAQRGLVFERSQWKRSRKKTGYLIRRLRGYSIAETEYGVSYLWVISRKPDKTTADNSVHPLAGYFNWKALEASGLLVKERKNDKRDKSTAIAG